MNVKEKIKQRRLQMIVHSCLYYSFNTNLVSDTQWSKWAKELAELQNKYPNIAQEVEYDEYFKDWDGSTGFDLPINDEWVVNKAMQLLRIEEKGKK